MAAVDTATSNYQRARDAGFNRTVITANETNQLKIGSGRVQRVIVWDVGTTFTLDLYDGITNVNKVWGWVSANGVGVFFIDIPMTVAIRVVTGGTAGGITIIWD